MHLQQLVLRVLCERDPDLDYNALDALMRRDSQRSSKTSKIAWTLGVHAHWLQDGSFPKYNPLSPYCPPSERSDLESPSLIRPTMEVPAVVEITGSEDGSFEQSADFSGEQGSRVAFPTQDRRAYALRVRGDWLHPRYRDGEYVVVEPGEDAQPGDDVVVVCKNGRRFLRVLAWRKGDSVSLLPVGGTGAPLSIPQTDIAEIHAVAGTVSARAVRKET